jgi:hypothetical protein
MLFDNNSQTDNASSSSINTAETNGYQNCSTTTGAIYLEGPDKLNVYPNPANNILYINNLPDNTETIEIVNIEGKKVMELKATDTIDISKLAFGVYQINFRGNNWIETKKIIVK